MAGVELRGLAKRFPNGIEAVSGVDLTVTPGEFLTVVGPSGSGKSTFLRLIAGLESPTAGSVSIKGRDVSARAPRERDVAMVFQDPALFPHLSVFENLAFGLRARGVSRVETRERVETVAGSLGLTEMLDRRPGTLSGGQRQRVALGRAVVRRPSVFLFDEPLSRLDAPLRASIRSELIDLHRRLDATMILVTHDQAEALATGDRVAVMERGRVVQVGAPREVHDRPATRFVGRFLGSPPMSMVPCEVLDGDGSVRVGLEGVAGRSLPGPPAIPFGRRVDLGVRPEHVRLSRAGEAAEPGVTPFVEEARVIRVEYFGNESIVTLGVGWHEFCSRLSPSTPARPGDLFALGVVLDRVSWFDPETGKALASGSAACL